MHHADMAKEHGEREERAPRMVDTDEARMSNHVERLLAAIIRMRAPADVGEQAGGVAQAGDPLSRDLTKRQEWGTGGSGPRNANKPIGVAEPAKKKFERGSVGLAYRTGYKPETADSQFFILQGPNPALDGKYAMLGKVVKGMDVVDKIAAVPTTTRSAPAASHASAAARSRMPPPTCTLALVDRTIRSTSAACAALPERAPSRSTTCTRSAPADAKRAASATGSSAYTVTAS